MVVWGKAAADGGQGEELLAFGNAVFETFSCFELRNHFVRCSIALVRTRYCTAFAFLQGRCKATEANKCDIFFRYECICYRICKGFDCSFCFCFCFVVTVLLNQFDKLCFVHKTLQVIEI